MCSPGNELVPKLRKPYTITRRRERWTDEEHNRFLEALKLYGRAWRRIEEHIGTKTAVQIRSHAQKFFSKVVEDPQRGGAESIEIPPPRPKRKPLHPYPRKLGYSPSRDVAFTAAKRSPSPTSSVSEQGDRSPTSVLCSLPISSQQSCCTSPDSSANPSCQLGTSSTDQDNFCPQSSEEDRSQSKHPPSIDIGLQEADSEMETDMSTQDNSPAGSLKLFGRTVRVADSQNPPPCTAENSPEHLTSPSGIYSNDREDTANVEVEQGDVSQRQHFGIPCQDGLNPWPCGMPPMIFFGVTEATISSLPWWPLCGVPYPLIPSYNIGQPQEFASPSTEEQDDKATQKPGPWAGGSTCSGETMTGDKNLPEEEETTNTGVAHLRSGVRTTSVPALGSRGSGFVPYRCVLEPSKIATEEDECQRVQLQL
ncbi:hypothetical protein Taro_019637 [Colocasia esculenta]|uniref:Uncharacterized protein n=1 Tax=Colocasia esculenta TaxID=4460 RepID=A0A843ULI9_COLES|nr:hypothetical protein [Colocasia esculenta]